MFFFQILPHILCASAVSCVSFLDCLDQFFSVKPGMLFFIQTLPRILCASATSRVSFLDLFWPIAGATNPITWHFYGKLHVWFLQNGRVTLCFVCVFTHKRYHHAIYSTLSRGTIYSLEELFMVWKYILQLGGSFCRIVCLILITWCSLTQLMNKNVWMMLIHVIRVNYDSSSFPCTRSTDCIPIILLWVDIVEFLEVTCSRQSSQITDTNHRAIWFVVFLL